MKNKIKRFAKGDFHIPQPEIIFPQTRIIMRVGEGEKYRGSFSLQNQGEGTIRGIVYPSSYRVQCDEQGFDANPVNIYYTYDGSGLVPGHVEHGKFTIVCNGGEFDIAFTAIIEKPYVMTSYGKVQSLDDFKKLSVNDKEQEILKKSKIQNINSISIKNLQEIYDKANKIYMEEKLDICEFNLTENMPVTMQDDFYMIINDENLSINTNCVGLVNCNENKVVAVGYLKVIDEKYYLIFAEKNIDYNSFEKNSSFKVIVFPVDSDLSLKNRDITLYEKECNIYYKKLEDTNNALCIDFGTSNTTAGSYKILNPNADYEHSVELVKFLDVTDNDIEKEIFPTIVYVKSCENEKIEYLFGYEAKKTIIDNDYDTKASVFYEIKNTGTYVIYAVTDNDTVINLSSYFSVGISADQNIPFSDL